ncbi:sigma-70 family RNA polymerase sigma factor [Altererythrobacter sp. C41]|uniref:sigma-70 family RNA polymerase sigma factor n=1 Tax=Altererythrobacter sp. C41 TaxID=2806021 RepID=UPI0019334B55|nr:sigma-70 family RNA polymerase sigma factor [Altererythrobacter sp. C41]MBM0171319.1 sigma-70 family RNA polymerase sigma factor [Altererythrobacter sp. C41]
MTAPRSSAAFDAFYRSEHPRMLRYFRKKVGPDAAPDLAQDAFTRLLRNQAFDSLDCPEAYLTRTARNLLIDRARRQARQQALCFEFDEERDAAICAEQTWQIEAEDLRRACWQALRAMPPRTRRIFLMHRLRHLTYKQIAEQLGISNKAVKYHMARALARCRRALTPS